MRKKYLICSLRLGVIALCAPFLKKFCYDRTGGFALHKILSTLEFNPDWECPATSQVESNGLDEILDQPFYYLARGAQAFVFASEDGNSVIKLFRLSTMRLPRWMTMVSFPLPLEHFRLCKILEKRRALDKDFQSYKIAFEKMQEETGLIYLHLNKTNHLKKRLRIYDKIGIGYDLDLDGMEFLIQKRATLFYPTIEELLKTEGLVAAKQAVSDLLHLLMLRSEKGIFDKDPDLNTNFGFLGKCPIQIDIGRFRYDDQRTDPAIYRDDIIRITDNFRQWLDTTCPDLSEHLLSEIGKIQV